MNKILIVLLGLISPMLIDAKNIYISQSSGSDSNSGTSADKPIKTTTKLNTITLSGGASNGETIIGVISPKSNVKPILYPNPCIDEVFFSQEISDEVTEIKIINSTGRQIRYENFANNSNSINLSSLKSGYYLIEVRLKNQNHMVKIIKL